MNQCKHGIVSSYCADCNVKDSFLIRQSEIVRETTVYDLAEKKTNKDYAVINTSGLNKVSKVKLNKRLKFVHIQGIPYLWTIRLLLENLSDLEVIQISPKSEKFLGQSHRNLCSEKNVKIITGYHNPNHIWNKGENRSPYYNDQREFLMTLKGEQKDLFEELINLGFRDAQFVARYFCLKGEEFKTQTELAPDFDFNISSSIVSGYINSVLRYLDPTFQTGKSSLLRAEAMHKKVLRLRKMIAQTHYLEETANSIGLEKIPEKFPLSRLDILEAIANVSNSQIYTTLSEKKPKFLKVLTLRYGFEDNNFRTLEEVGKIFGLTQERIRQMEEEAFKFLWILNF